MSSINYKMKVQPLSLLLFISLLYISVNAAPKKTKGEEDTSSEGVTEGSSLKFSTKCRYSREGSEYVGADDSTKSGKKCIRWDQANLPWYFTDDGFPEGSISFARNYCRNPYNSLPEPWCYVNANDWEYCSIPYCNA